MRQIDSAFFVFFFLIYRKLHSESGTLANDAFNADAPVMLFDYLPTAAESESSAAMSVLVGFLGRIEWLEDQPQLIRSDADTRVGNSNFRHLRLQIGPHVDSQPAAIGHG